MRSPERGFRLIHQFVYGRSIPARPVLDCDVQANGRSRGALAIVDSGADDNLSPMYVARELGLAPVGESRETMHAGFSDAIRFGVLGQNGFFDPARVKFDRRSRFFTVEQY